MTPIEKAERALNLKIEELQTRIQAAGSDQPRPDLVQALLICASVGDAITEYVAAISRYAKQRHAELKEQQRTLTVEHDRLLQVGADQLERFKANPTDAALFKEVKTAQRRMEEIQKTLRRGATSLQNDVNPSIRIFDTLADQVRRLCESEDKAEIKRWTKAIVQQPAELYRAHPALPTQGVVDTASWENSASTAIDEATDFLDAQSRAGFQAILVLEIMIMAISPSAPQSNEEATERANAAVAARTKKLMARLTGNANEA